MPLLLSFSLDDLRARFPPRAGADPRHDTAPFRAFRAALLDALTARAVAPAELSFAWEGTFNGYALVVSIDPADAIPDAAAGAPCPVETDPRLPAAADPRLPAAADPRLPAAADRRLPATADSTTPPPRSRYPLAHVAPGEARVARDADGASYEAPFGAPTGHFGAPGVRLVRASAAEEARGEPPRETEESHTEERHAEAGRTEEGDTEAGHAEPHDHGGHE